MSGETDFKLSRIYAEGWNAAGQLSAADNATFEEQGIAGLNPYAEERERTRWAEGFGNALGVSTNRLPARSADAHGRRAGRR